MDERNNGNVIDAETLVYILGTKEAELFVLRNLLKEKTARIAELEAKQGSASAESGNAA